MMYVYVCMMYVYVERTGKMSSLLTFIVPQEILNYMLACVVAKLGEGKTSPYSPSSISTNSTNEFFCLSYHKNLVYFF